MPRKHLRKRIVIKLKRDLRFVQFPENANTKGKKKENVKFPLFFPKLPFSFLFFLSFYTTISTSLRWAVFMKYSGNWMKLLWRAYRACPFFPFYVLFYLSSRNHSRSNPDHPGQLLLLKLPHQNLSNYFVFCDYLTSSSSSSLCTSKK